MCDNEFNIQEQEIQDENRIDCFLQGRMNEEEEKTFLAELNQNKELRDRAILQARLVKGLAQVDEEIIDAYKEVEKRANNNKSTVVLYKQNFARWLAIAASIVFIVFVGFNSYDYYDTTSLGKKFANTFPTSTIIRGEADQDVETELKTLFNNIAEGKDLDNTTSRLATLWELSKQETYNDYINYAPYIGWNLAIGYLRNYEKAKAKDILEEMELMFDSETAIGIKVRELKKEI